ncbi:uncharacterized protein METZ01_LOCUS71117 [marine metagenome]|uniref:Uncharacterized protein n=1 Tax=marine metagenome TaxID=408172 RepID=A0A381TVY9_9ZZZZ
MVNDNDSLPSHFPKRSYLKIGVTTEKFGILPMQQFDELIEW